MRYQIFRIQQESMCEIEMSVEEALLLDWLLNWKDGGSMKRVTISNDSAYWVNYGKVVEELPSMFSKVKVSHSDEEIKKINRNNRTKVGRMIKRLEEMKVIVPHKVRTQVGTDIYVSFNRDMIDYLVNGNKKAPKPLVEEKGTKKKTTRTNSICNSKENNTSNEKINKDVNVVNEVVEILEKEGFKLKDKDKEEAIELMIDIDRLKKCIEVYNEKFKNKNYSLLKGFYDNHSFSNENKSSKSNQKYEGTWINDSDLDSRIEESQRRKFQEVREHKFI